MDDIYDLRIGDGDGELVMEVVMVGSNGKVVMVVVMKVMVMIMLGLFEMGCLVRWVPFTISHKSTKFYDNNDEKIAITTIHIIHCNLQLSWTKSVHFDAKKRE